jgi:hypothetical protein
MREASCNGQTLTFTVMLEAACLALPIERASDGLALAIFFFSNFFFYYLLGISNQPYQN